MNPTKMTETDDLFHVPESLAPWLEFAAKHGITTHPIHDDDGDLWTAALPGGHVGEGPTRKEAIWQCARKNNIPDPKNQLV